MVLFLCGYLKAVDKLDRLDHKMAALTCSTSAQSFCLLSCFGSHVNSLLAA